MSAHPGPDQTSGTGQRRTDFYPIRLLRVRE